MSANKRSAIVLARLRKAAVLAACSAVATTTLAACSATGFGAPTRHAIANLQAADTKIGSTLEIEDAIIALPSDDTSNKGGLAYLQMDAINFANTPDELVNVSADLSTPASPAASASAVEASTAPAAESLQAAGGTTVPAATASGPGTIRINVLLRTLTAPLSQGDYVTVGLTFKNSGSISGLLVPVQGAGVVGSFLPTAPPPPSSAPASSPVPASSAPASAPAASPVSSGSAPASAPAAASSS